MMWQIWLAGLMTSWGFKGDFSVTGSECYSLLTEVSVPFGVVQALGPKKRITMGEAAGDRVLSRLHSVRERIGDSLSAHPNELVAVFTRSALTFPLLSKLLSA